MKLISAQNISYRINEKMLFHNLSLEVFSGEGLHIKGGNGSGKSTLLKILLGITSVSKGLIEYKNQDLKISYLGHKNAIKNYLTPAQNLQLLFDDLSLTNAFEWLEKLDLYQVQDELTANLSFGQQKKLALIRVLAQSSELIVLDEPFVGLDKAASELLNSFFLQKLSEGTGLILTSHIQPSVECQVIELDKTNV
jgi:heme exporter protein A